MKAVRTTAAGGLEVVDAPEPGIGDGEALIELICCGLCGTDLYKLAQAGRTPGEVLGHEVVGRVIESRTDGLALGDRVVAPHHAPCGDCRPCRSGAETMCARFAEDLLDPGGFSERLRLKARAVQHTVRKLDDGLADEAAVFVEPAACVLRGVDRAGLSGEAPEVTVLGAGSMGLLHLLVLRATFPGARIVVAEPAPDRRAMALELGADAAAAPAEVAGMAWNNVPEGGADAVFDTAGGQRAFDLALQVTRPGGRVVLFAHAARDARVTFDINKVFRSERQVIGAYSGSPAEQARALDLLHEGALDPTPLVTHRLPLDRAAEAVDLCRRGQALKVLLHP
ncbi:MAG: alcohol dehydrogenase catalytic domain-containing protein [Acidobacteriota bacterium]|nr:alcohol dehydrogenase catalytic domain-containing protein [Acidobacteriota bacterium]